MIGSDEPLRFRVDVLPVDAKLPVFLWSEANVVALLLPLIVTALEVLAGVGEGECPLVCAGTGGFFWVNPAGFRTVTATFFAAEAAVDAVDVVDLNDDAVDGGLFDAVATGLSLFGSMGGTGGRFVAFTTNVTLAADGRRDLTGDVEGPSPVV